MAVRVLAFIIAMLIVFPASAGYITKVPMSGWKLSYSSHAGGVRYSSRGRFYFPKISESKIAYCSKRKHRCKSAHYLWRSVRGTLRQGKDITVTYLIRDWGTGAKFNWKTEPSNKCPGPARLSVIIQRRGDNMRSANGRFWNKYARPELKNGQYTIRATLNRKHWINVYGRTPSKSAWRSMKKNVGRIGVTFGGGCFYGHGVNVYGGKAHFMLRSVRIK